MIEKLQFIKYFRLEGTRAHLNELMEKQNEIIDVLNAQQESKPGRTLWVNKDCKVVEFCCDELKAEFKFGCSVCLYKYAAKNMEEYVLRRTYRYRQWCALREEPFDSREYTKCPYCNAAIARYKTNQWPEVQIALRNKDAEELNIILEIWLKKAIATCESYPYRTGESYDIDYERTQLYMRIITALNNKGQRNNGRN